MKSNEPGKRRLLEAVDLCQVVFRPVPAFQEETRDSSGLSTEGVFINFFCVRRKQSLEVKEEQ